MPDINVGVLCYKIGTFLSKINFAVRGGQKLRVGERSSGMQGAKGAQRSFKKEDWMRFLNPDNMKLKGEEPDFTEEGWARRRPKKK